MMQNKLIFGFGMNDVDYPVTKSEKVTDANGKTKYKRVWTCPYYIAWAHMVGRCYSEKLLDARPSYRECSVIETWASFSNFKAWMECQDWQGKSLDKDLLVFGNKVYSPESCIFVSSLVNGFITEKRCNMGKYPTGVSFDKDRGNFKAKCSDPFTGKDVFLGRFSSPQEAHLSWLSYKLTLAKRIANLESDERVATALVSRYEDYKEN